MFDDFNITSLREQIAGITGLRIHHGINILSIQAEYILANGSTYLAESHGGIGGQEDRIQFSSSEVITEVRGLTDRFLVYQLLFITTDGSGNTRQYGPYGNSQLTPFSVQEQVIGFYGMSGGIIDSIGFIYVG